MFISENNNNNNNNNNDGAMFDNSVHQKTGKWFGSQFLLVETVFTIEQLIFVIFTMWFLTGWLKILFSIEPTNPIRFFFFF